jgi:hypothetical protein
MTDNLNLKSKMSIIELKMLRSGVSAGELPKRQMRFKVNGRPLVSREAVYKLLELCPIFAIRIDRKHLYRVIFGRRLFELAAQILDPSDAVQVNIVTSKLSEETIQKLHYLDTVVIPTINSLDMNYAELYDHINSDISSARQVWTASSKADFSKVFKVSPSLLSQKAQKPDLLEKR